MKSFYSDPKYFIFCSVFFLVINTGDSFANEKIESFSSKETILHNSLLNKKIEFYRALYPDIAFLILQRDRESYDDLVTLDVVLGYQPQSLDYEHPPELREDLMYASIERILIMLNSGLSSASTFKVDTPLGWQERVCVLTINAGATAADSIMATKDLLNFSRKAVQKIPNAMLLHPDDYLAFVIDHEVYHCLKSINTGPQLMSKKDLWAGYNNYHEEQAADADADAYALAMHIKYRNDKSNFAENILRIRGMGLYNADPDHLTYRALEEVLKVPSKQIEEMSAKEVFYLANTIKKHMTLSYDLYLQHLSSVAQAMKEIGLEILVSEELSNKLKDVQVNQAEVKRLITITHRSFEELFGAYLKQ